MVEAFRRGAGVVRQKVLEGLRAAGGFDLLADSKWRRSRVLVLCYHGVSLDDEHEWNPELFVTEAFLRRRFEIIRDRGYRVIDLGEAIERCAAGTLPERSVVLTFDDGLADFALRALPLLQEFRFPATVYVTSYYSQKQWPVAPPVHRYVLWKAGSRSSRLSWPEVGISPSYLPSSPRERRDIAQALAEFAERKGLSGEARWEITQELAARLNVDLEVIRRRRILHIMTGDEIRQVADAGIDVQLHTHRHRVPRDAALFQAEIRDNRAWLEPLIGRAANHFCYPSGVVFDECLPWLRQLGVASATTCFSGLHSRDIDPLIVPRFIDTFLQSETMFEGWLSGAAAILRRREGSRRGLPERD